MNPGDQSAHNKLWLNGSIVAEEEARISPFDHGLLTGDGVFETLISYDGIKPFAFSRHLERLIKSAQPFGLNVPRSELLSDACEAVLALNNAVPARLRITITAGRAPLGSEKGSDSENVIVASSQASEQPPHSKVITVPYVRNERGALVGLKTTSYGENVVALALAHSKGAREAIFGNVSGNLCEGSGSNIFIVSNGQLITPPLSSGCLPGVTRALALEICNRIGITVNQINFPITDLTSVDSAFLTSTLRQIQSIESIDGVPLNVMESNDFLKIKNEFNRLVQSEIDP
ncbi:MAG TPA: 4-amino-4-deoxychorismate lyase [Verrucomicrobia bacterium]|nr:4-amino-4-deoxychorismate lyase [Verrucomicrobiales bacterium]HIL54224.1 4-amino-4-deoxychorismate lyase [Verrucomicrobiota bacterium]